MQRTEYEKYSLDSVVLGIRRKKTCFESMRGWKLHTLVTVCRSVVSRRLVVLASFVATRQWPSLVDCSALEFRASSTGKFAAKDKRRFLFDDRIGSVSRTCFQSRTIRALENTRYPAGIIVLSSHRYCLIRQRHDIQLSPCFTHATADSQWASSSQMLVERIDATEATHDFQPSPGTRTLSASRILLQIFFIHIQRCQDRFHVT